MQPLDELTTTVSGTGTPTATSTASATNAASSTGAAVAVGMDVSSSGLLGLLGLGVMAFTGGMLVL
jgi:hypothetical protein